jgi:hypothetical protein
VALKLLIIDLIGYYLVVKAILASASHRDASQCTAENVRHCRSKPHKITYVL